MLGRDAVLAGSQELRGAFNFKPIGPRAERPPAPVPTLQIPMPAGVSGLSVVRYRRMARPSTPCRQLCIDLRSDRALANAQPTLPAWQGSRDIRGLRLILRAIKTIT
jgi:hypothetical protein